MGNTNYLNTNHIEDERYGIINKFQYENNTILQKNLDFTNVKDQLLTFTQLLDQSKQLDHKNLFKLHKYEQDGNQISVFCDYHEYDLNQDVESRRKELNYYTETQLIQIYDQLVSVLAYLQQFQILHNDLQPKNIHYLPNGVIKLSHFWVIGVPSKFRYSAPEQQPNIFKQTAFALGMTMIHLMTLTQLHFCYGQKVHLSLIYELLNSSEYSQEFTNKIRNLVQKIQFRPDFLEIQYQHPKLIHRLVQNSPTNDTIMSLRQSPNKSPMRLVQHLPRVVLRPHSPVTFRKIQHTSGLSHSPLRISKQIQRPKSPSKDTKASQTFQSPKSPYQEHKENVLDNQFQYSSKIGSDLDKRVREALESTNKTLLKNKIV